MSNITVLVNDFWQWVGNIEYWSHQDVSLLPVDPLSYPQFEELRNCCISLINSSLSAVEVDAFLTCMALESEDEHILDACKASANETFLQTIISAGVVHAQSEARWQMAELLRARIPNRERLLDILLSDKHPYVRQRATNIVLYPDF